METPQILSNFKDFLSEKYFLMDLEARDDCVKKLMHILEIENISLPELAKNIETIITYHGGKWRRKSRTICIFCEYLNYV